MKNQWKEWIKRFKWAYYLKSIHDDMEFESVN